MARKKSRSIKQQLYYAVNQNFKEGMDKYSLKKDRKMNGTRIFSYADRKNLVDFTANFANWLSQNHREVRLAVDINSKHVQEFLNDKAKTCSKATVEQYMSKANKMQNLINITYRTNSKLDIKLPSSIKEKYILRDKQMTVEHYELLEKNINENGLKSIECARNFGLRVSEIAKLEKRDIKLEEGIIRVVDSKGKKTRDVDIVTEEQMKIARKLFNSVTSQRDRIVKIRENSINQALKRAMEKAEIKEEYKVAGIHSIRKLYAQETYDRLRSEGLSKKQAKEEVSEQLGHSRERGNDDNLIRIYIKNTW